MEVLHFGLEKATQQGTSIYVNDVVAFLHTNVGDLKSFAAIIDDFGAASCLRTNLSKCYVHLIRCPVETSALVDQELGVLCYHSHYGTSVFR
jgi:hypothetical protein